jgi:excisionase family DNA binding protein
MKANQNKSTTDGNSTLKEKLNVKNFKTLSAPYGYNVRPQKITYTVPEIAEILRIGRGKAYKLIKRNLFPVIYIDNSIRIPSSPFYNWLNSLNQAT